MSNDLLLYGQYVSVIIKKELNDFDIEYLYCIIGKEELFVYVAVYYFCDIFVKDYFNYICLKKVRIAFLQGKEVVKIERWIEDDDYHGLPVEEKIAIS